MAAEQEVTRKLRAILSADVKGYSRLMSDDESYTIRTLKEYRNIMSKVIKQHSGRVVDAPGDNLLAEFSSIVNAVQSAVEIQKTLNQESADVPNDKKLEFRIGINIGDVVQDGDSLYGEGVNIAARIEGLADPGGICISRGAYDHIRNKLKLGYEYIGEHSVKNIKNPVRVYKILTEPENIGKLIGVAQKHTIKQWAWPAVIVTTIIMILIGYQLIQKVTAPDFEPASMEKMAFPLPNKPSIAVLPFDNLSNDPKQEYFSDGLTDQIIGTLSKIRDLFVIARNSTFTYKGTPVKVQRIAEELGVRYVLEGSVQRTADRVRVTAQLIDATTGHHVWSERYDREQKDIFDIQDDITMEITKALEVELVEGEQARIWQKDQTNNLAAYEKFLQGHKYYGISTKKATARARKLFNEAIALDPEYAAAYTYLGWTHFADARAGWATSKAESIKRAYVCAQKSFQLKTDYPYTYILMGLLSALQGQYEKGIDQVQHALAIEPNSAEYHAFLAGVTGVSGRWREGIGYSEISIRLSPKPPALYYWMLGRACFMTSQYDKAIEAFKKAVHIGPDHFYFHAFLSACYSSLDRHTEAAAEASEVLRLNPQFTLESYAKTLPYKNESDIERYISALRKAGLPEKPPLPLPDKPSIAVLAFDNMTGDPTQDYFCNGIAEEIITVLSMVDKLFVIARNSSFSYKGKPVKIQQISKELGVRYVLEGSVRRSGDSVRVTAQLIDAIKGQHIWAESYDRDFKDIFKIQDEISMRVVSSLQIKLTEGEQARIWQDKNMNSDVYKKHLQLTSNWGEGTRDGLERCGQLAQEIIDIAPESGIGYRWLGWYHYGLVMRGISPRENVKKAFKLAQKALSIDEYEGFSHSLLGFVYLLMKKYDEAIASGKRSVELQPNGAIVHLIFGSTLNYAGRFDEAMVHLKQAIRLNPFPHYYYYYHLGACYMLKEEFEDSLKEFRKVVQRVPNWPLGHLFLAVNYIHLDRNEEAHDSAAKALELDPNLSVSFIRKVAKIKNQAHTQKILDAMRKAGFPE